MYISVHVGNHTFRPGVKKWFGGIGGRGLSNFWYQFRTKNLINLQLYVKRYTCFLKVFEPTQIFNSSAGPENLVTNPRLLVHENNHWSNYYPSMALIVLYQPAYLSYGKRKYGKKRSFTSNIIDHIKVHTVQFIVNMRTTVYHFLIFLSHVFQHCEISDNSKTVMNRKLIDRYELCNCFEIMKKKQVQLKTNN